MDKAIEIIREHGSDEAKSALRGVHRFIEYQAVTVTIIDNINNNPAMYIHSGTYYIVDADIAIQLRRTPPRNGAMDKHFFFTIVGTYPKVSFSEGEMVISKDHQTFIGVYATYLLENSKLVDKTNLLTSQSSEINNLVMRALNDFVQNVILQTAIHNHKSSTISWN